MCPLARQAPPLPLNYLVITRRLVLQARLERRAAEEESLGTPPTSHAARAYREALRGSPRSSLRT